MFLANFRHRVTDSADKMNFVETWGSRALEQGDYFGSEICSREHFQKERKNSCTQILT